jgi:peptide/nickel transport system permease protein
MVKYILRRLFMMIPVLLGVGIIVFTMLCITPGDPAAQILGNEATSEELNRLRAELGLNKSYIERLGSFFYNLVFKFDFGTSYMTKKPVIEMIQSRMGNTFVLATASVFISVLMGLILGIVSATKPYSLFDNMAMSFALVGVSMPNFWQGLLLMLLFSLQLKLLPATGFSSWRHVILPALTVGTSACAIIARLTRSSMLEVINSDYIYTVRAKGQKEWVVITRHALKNALIPIVTAVGLQFGAMLGGSLLTETVFAIPGLGKLMVDSIKARDYPVVQGGVLFIAFLFSVVNLLVDIIYALVDPRVRSSYH